ncbi:NmrA-like family protein [Macrophomina phaseolina]|uniref:NmrA-like family protein n=1 Tax=Macrophomina phaseolina TaxID=35725 RepID=A0ABQ8FV16_9PEZI|nr:NmrA-like family protein [Macrophomina phaseolina]
MLILIAGITGFVGIPCAKAAIARGHKVRGLARDASRLPKDVLDKLEGFESMSGYYDISALDRAVAGVDAIINTMPANPESIMEGQLLLIRAAERAGVKPIYMFTGAIAEWYFRKSPYDWDSKTKTFSFHGPSTSPTRYTTAGDLANYVLEAITAPTAADGGYVCVQSFEASPEDVVKAYNAARQGRITANLKCLGTLEDAKAQLDHGRAIYSKRECYNYLWYTYQYYIPMRAWDYEPVDVARFPNVKQTSLEEFFRQNPDV